MSLLSRRVRAEGCFRIVFDSAGSAGVVFDPTLVVGHGITLSYCSGCSEDLRQETLLSSPFLPFLLLFLLSEEGKLPSPLSGGSGLVASASSWRSYGVASWSEEEGRWSLVLGDPSRAREFPCDFARVDAYRWCSVYVFSLVLVVSCHDTRQKATCNLSHSGGDRLAFAFPSSLQFLFPIVAEDGSCMLTYFRVRPSDVERDGSIRRIQIRRWHPDRCDLVATNSGLTWLLRCSVSLLSRRVRVEGCFRIVFDSAGSARVVSGPTLVVGRVPTALAGRDSLTQEFVARQLWWQFVASCIASSVSCERKRLFRSELRVAFLQVLGVCH
ncbi:hypothetical protein Taro_036810, partial [Colocasia esculenta]|nr:hypothetical protein [Colocasia esculenta]